jgi:spermidine synthase
LTATVPGSSRSRALPTLETVILGLFFLSGASALVYEVVWTRDLTNVFGGSAFAVATVLAAFMAGLALGSTVFGRAIDRRGHPLVVYGILEAGVAVWALILPVLFGLLDHVYAGVYRSLDPGFYVLSLLRFVLTFLVLLVPTTMMGGTLPVLGKLLLRHRERLGQRAGLLYGANTLGAVLGTAAGGFVLLPALGLRGSTLSAVGLNFLVAATAVALSRVLAGSPAGADSGGGVPAPEAAPALPVRPALHRAVLAVYAAGGFAALAYEVAWTKTLSMILGNTTYAFTAMLTTFLLGLSLGSFLFSRLADRHRNPAALLVLVQIGISLSALAGIPLLGDLPTLFVKGYPAFSGSWASLEGFKVLLAGLTMIVPTLLMGATFPLVTRIYVRGGHTGKELGTLYASNTVGAILGSFLTGFVLIPWLGRQESILAATLVNLAAAGLLLAVLRWRTTPVFVRATAAALTLLLAPAAVFGLRPWDPQIMASGAYVYVQFIVKEGSIKKFMDTNNLLFYGESTEAAVSVWNTEFTLSLRTNGKVEASSHGDMVTQKMICHLPVLYHRDEPRTALMIGLASGISAGALLTHPLESVDTVELIPTMKKAARYFDEYNYRCLDDPRNHLIMNDGRNHLLLTDKKYDIIVSEPSNPWIAGVSSLFTREFFELTKERLAPGGVVCQWVQTYQFSEDDLKTVLATFADAYPYVHLWRGAPGDLIVVASMDPLRLDLDRLRQVLDTKAGEDIRSLELLPIPHLLSLFLTDRDGIRGFVGSWPKRVTDDNLYLEYSVPRHMLALGREVKTKILGEISSPLTPFLTGTPYPALDTEIENYRRARDIAYTIHENKLPPGMTSREQALKAALVMAPRELLARTLYSRDVNEEAIQNLLAGNVDAAEPGFRRALEIGVRSECAIAHNNLGAIAFRVGKLDSAGYHWHLAVQEEPDYPVVLRNLALLAMHEGDIESAIAYSRRVLAFGGETSDACNNMAYYLALKGQDLEEAETYARRAVDLDRSLNNRDTLGYVLLRRQKWKEAESVLEAAVQEDGAFLEGLLHLGMARAGMGQDAAARAAFESVIRTAPDSSLVEEARAELEKL